MLLFRSFAFFLIFTLSTLNAAICASAESNALNLSRKLVNMIDIRNNLADHFADRYPPQHKEIFKQILATEDQIFEIANEDLARMYAKMYSEKELADLTAFFGSGVGKKWLRDQSTFFNTSIENIQRENSYLKQISTLGCATAIFIPQLERFKQQEGIKTPGIPPELVPGIKPMMSEFKGFCSCLLGEGAKKYGNNFVYSPKAQSSEFLQYTDQLINEGICKLPGS